MYTSIIVTQLSKLLLGILHQINSTPVGQTIFKDATSGTISTAGNSKTVTGSGGTVFIQYIPSVNSKIKFTKIAPITTLE